MKLSTDPVLIAGSLLLTACLLCPGCVSPAGEKPEPRGTATPALEGTAWDLASYLGAKGTMASVLPTTRITAGFSPDLNLTGSAGCNRYFAGYGAGQSSVAIEGIGSTLMACMDPGVMEQESRYLALLGSAAQFRIDGDQLVLSDAYGTPILVFAKAKPELQMPLTGTSWVLESYHHGTGAVVSLLAGTRIDAVFSDDGKVTGSAGCNRYFASFNRTGESLRLGPRGSTKMYCGEPRGIMEQEQPFLALLGSVAGFEISGGRLILKDATGSTVLSFRAS